MFVPHIDSNVLQVAKKMGVKESDLIKYGTNFDETEKRSGNDLEDAILLVAKMMDVSNDDIMEYGLGPSDKGLTETDADKIKRLLNSD